MASLALQPRLGSRQFHQAAGPNAQLVPFRSGRRCAGSSQGRRRRMAVLVRTTQKHQVAHDAALSIVRNEPSSPQAHEPRMKTGLNFCLGPSSIENGFDVHITMFRQARSRTSHPLRSAWARAGAPRLDDHAPAHAHRAAAGTRRSVSRLDHPARSRPGSRRRRTAHCRPAIAPAARPRSGHRTSMWQRYIG
jgi:hypothetical protein